MFVAEVGDQGEQQQDDADGQQQVAVAVEVARAADDGQGEHVGGHPAGRPGRLQRGVVGGRAQVDPQDHHVAEAVEQEGDGQDDRVGVGHEDAVGDVGHRPEPQHGQQEGHHVGGHLGGVAEDHQGVGGHDDHRGRHQQPELGAPAGLEGPAERVLDSGVRKVMAGIAASLPAATGRSGEPAGRGRRIRWPGDGIPAVTDQP